MKLPDTFLPNLINTVHCFRGFTAHVQYTDKLLQSQPCTAPASAPTPAPAPASAPAPAQSNKGSFCSPSLPCPPH